MQTREVLKTLTRRDVQLIAERAQGKNDLRNVLKVGGLYGRAVNAAEERCAAAALEGLRDGWYAAGDESEYYAGEEQAWYRAAREHAIAVRQSAVRRSQRRAA
jgi:hypothetical protein